MFLGAHMSISGGIEKSPLRGAEAGCSAIQIFTKSSNIWHAKPLTDREVFIFRENLVKAGIEKVVAHDCYLINLASPDSSLLKKSQDTFLIEMQRAERLGIPYLIFHPGSHKGSGVEAGIDRIAGSLKQLLKKTEGYKLKLVLETTAGQGTSVGYEFEHLKAIIDLIGCKKRLGVCIDTCHIFAAGYDIRNKKGYDQTFNRVEKNFGIDMVKVFHLNDSKKDLGSMVDRHEHIGKGFLGIEPFRYLMHDQRFKELPMILETPKGHDMKEDKMNLGILMGLKKS